jgi:hypothetical protein
MALYLKVYRAVIVSHGYVHVFVDSEYEAINSFEVFSINLFTLINIYDIM